MSISHIGIIAFLYPFARYPSVCAIILENSVLCDILLYEVCSVLFFVNDIMKKNYDLVPDDFDDENFDDEFDEDFEEISDEEFNEFDDIDESDFDDAEVADDEFPEGDDIEGIDADEFDEFNEGNDNVLLDGEDDPSEK